MLDRPPRVFVSYAHDSPDHKAQVDRFATFLKQRIRLDVHWDQQADGPRIDWSLWATGQLTADFVIVVASPAYKRRAEGTESPGVGHGSKFEAARIRDRLTKDIDGETARILPVVLPGGSVDDIPDWLNPHSTTRFEIDEISSEGLAPLLAAINGHNPNRPHAPMPCQGGPVRVANGMPWRSHGSGVRVGSASIGGVRYDDSIVLRPPSADPHGFVEIDLDGAYERMRSAVGVLDDAVEPFQVGLFRVLVDGQVRAERTVTLGRAAETEANLTGARILRLEMSRPGAGVTPMASRTWPDDHRPGRPPELAWGDPTVS